MFEPKRLHPLVIFITFAKELKGAILPVIALFAVGSRDNWIILLILVAPIILAFISGLMKWLTFRYWVEENQVRIHSGIFVKKQRYIPFERIHNINVTEGILHRPFHLVKLEIETAGSSTGAEASLDAISKADAESLKQLIAGHAINDQAEASIMKEHAQSPLYELHGKRLFTFAATAGGAIVMLGTLGALFSQMDELISWDLLFTSFERLSDYQPIISVLVAIMVLIALWLIAILLTIIRYYHFTVTKEDDKIHITRGLLERKERTIPLARIQGILVVENPLRQFLGFVSLKVVSAGGNALESGEGTEAFLLPLVKRDEVAAILSKILPEYPWLESVQPLPQQAKERYLRRPLFFLVPLVCLITYFWYPWGRYSLLLLPLGMGWGYFKYRAAGYDREGNIICFRWRFVSRKQLIAKRNHIQAYRMRQNPLQRRRDLVSVQISLKSGELALHGKVIDLDQPTARELYAWYSRN